MAKPPTPEEKFERYCFLRLCSCDFHGVKRTLTALAKGCPSELRGSVIRDLTVTYCRPFSGNHGRDGKQHRLEVDDHVPAASRDLHSELLKLRNSLFAHTDVTFHDPRVMMNIGTPENPCYPMSMSGGAPYAMLFSRTQEILTLANAVDESVCREIAKIQNEPWFQAADAAARASP